MLKVEQLGCRFGQQWALENISFELPQGQVLAVLGPSGCGKSSLLKVIAGMQQPASGRVELQHQLLADQRFSMAIEKRPINMVFQDYALWPHMKVEQIIGYGLFRLSAAAKRAKVAELLQLLHLEPYAQRLPAQLSGGQQQRVAIARALATDPQLLLFDEPLSNLDVQLRLEMRHELADLFARLGKTVLYVTHDPLEACAFADQLLILKQGRMEQYGPTQQLFANPASPWVAGLAGYDSRLEAQWLGAEGEYAMAAVGQQRIKARQPVDQRPEPGQQMQLLLPADRLRIMPGSGQPTEQDNALIGEVTQSLFEGQNWRVRLQLAGANLSIICQQPFAKGSKLRVHCPAEHALLFASQ